MEILTIILMVLLVTWTLFWKGYSIWTSARMGHKRWFVVLVVFNTLGILDIFYLSLVAKKTTKDIGAVLKRRI
jgi:hypothetical protein